MKKDDNLILELALLQKTTDASATLPARLTSEQVAEVLGYQPSDISVLIRKGHLKPLAKPTAQATKYFSKTKIIKLGIDEAWLSKTTQEIYDHWKSNNQKRLKSKAPKLDQAA